jgi:hypothetical protein
MPYPVAFDPQVGRDLHRKCLTAVNEHLLWAFNPQYAKPRSLDDAASRR